MLPFSPIMTMLANLRLLLSETKQRTLEEIAAAFGDRVVEVEDVDIATEEAITAAKNQSEHLE